MNDLDELDRLHAAATAGEWRIDRFSGELEAKEPTSLARDVYGKAPSMAAIVALHNAWPFVSARLRAAEAEVERLRGALRSVIAEVATEDEAWGGSLESRYRAALGEP